VPPPMPLDEALKMAYENRSDWKAEQAEIKADLALRRSEWAKTLPSLDVNADYGAIGQTFSRAHATYELGATVHLPVLEGGKVYGKVLQADADLARARERADDLRQRIDFEVRTSALDMDAGSRRVEVARSALALAEEQMAQAQDRFRAGVGNHIDVVQAQQALAGAHEALIQALYDQSVAAGSFARAVGVVESVVKQFVKGD
jgi:outer membrane protein TolC